MILSRSYMTLCLALTISASCVPAPATSVSRSAISAAGPRGCYDPVDYGAVPDDGIDDRVPAQSALDAAAAATALTGNPATVCFAPGRYTFTRAPLGSYNRFAALSTHGHDITIRCDDAVLEISGDQGGSTTILISIDPSAENIRVTGCTLASAGATNTAEQTHAIATTGNCSGATCRPIRNIQVDNVRFVWPKQNGERKGDCVRLIGNGAPSAEEPLGTELWGARVHDSTGDCARSFGEIQRGVHDLIVDHNTITCATCDQDIDGEATGVIGDAGRPTGIVIANNTFTDGPLTEGDFSISLTSITGATVVGNTMGRGIASYRSTGVVISGNAINATGTKTGRAVIEAVNACDGLVISGNTVRRGGHLGPVIGLAPHSGTSCSGAVIAGNSLTQGTPAWAISMESASSVLVADNRIAFTVAAPAFSGIYARSVVTGGVVEALKIANNQVTGPVTYGVTLDAYPGTFGAGVSVTGNVATGTVFGLRCTGSGGFSAPVASSGNTMGPTAYGAAEMTAGD